MGSDILTPSRTPVGRVHLRRGATAPSPTPQARRAGSEWERRFSVRDRIAVGAWQLEAGLAGYGRVAFDDATGVSEEERGEYLLIYKRGDEWARWGIGCGANGYLLWDAIRGVTVGVFPAIVTALATVLEFTIWAVSSDGITPSPHCATPRHGAADRHRPSRPPIAPDLPAATSPARVWQAQHRLAAD